MTTISPNRAVTDVQQSGNYNEGRPYGDPDSIVIHHWGGDGQRHQTVADYLCRYDGSSSAHYVASAGRVTQLVSDRDRAWHAGPSGNPTGIGIECRPEKSDGDFETVADLVAAIRDEHGWLPLHGHQEYMATACPGRWQEILASLSARADAIRGGAPANVPSAPSNPNANTDWWLEPDGIWGNKTGSRFRAVFGLGADAPWSEACQRFQYFFSWALDAYRLEAATGTGRMDVDGVDGPQTWGAFQAWYNASAIPAGHRIEVDGIYGPETIEAVQITLNHSWYGSRALATRP